MAYKNGKIWAEEIEKTIGEAVKLLALADRNEINADGKDLSFISIQISDKDGLMVPRTNYSIEFSIEGPGEIVATDNGDSYNMESFASYKHKAFNGMALVNFRSKAGEKGTIAVTAKSDGLTEALLAIQSK